MTPEFVFFSLCGGMLGGFVVLTAKLCLDYYLSQREAKPAGPEQAKLHHCEFSDYDDDQQVALLRLARAYINDSEVSIKAANPVCVGKQLVPSHDWAIMLRLQKLGLVEIDVDGDDDTVACVVTAWLSSDGVMLMQAVIPDMDERRRENQGIGSDDGVDIPASHYSQPKP